MNYLKERSLGLIAKGYGEHLRVIKPKTKIPAGGNSDGDRWGKSKQNSKCWETAIKSKESYGVGIITGEIVCVDVDVTDAMMTEAVLHHLEAKFGKNVRRRIGRAPKFAVFFRTDAPFRKITSSGWTSEEDQEKPHRLEILGDGQYSVLHGIHPDTGQEYTWPDGEMPRKEDLPLLTKAQAEELAQWFDEAAEDQRWKKARSRSKSRKEAEDDELAMPEPPLGEPEKIQKALAELSAEDYHDWIKYGQAIHHEFGGREEGFAVWDEWSSTASSYEGSEDCRKHWRSFDALKPNGITGRTILADAAKVRREREAGIEGTLAWMEENFIYVAETDQVVWIGEQGAHTRQPYSLKGFLEAFGGYTAPALTDKGKPTTKRVVDLWRKSPLKKVAHSAIYQPGKPEVFKEDGVHWLNTFRLPTFETVHDPAMVSVFLDHLGYLIPDEIDRQWFIGWLAKTMRAPAERLTTAPLHVSRAEGTGRGWVLQVMRGLLGEKNISTPEMTSFVSSQFNSYLANVILCAIEETDSGSHNRKEILELIKQKIDAPILRINEKHKAEKETRIYANMLFFSNNMDALPIEDRTRRFYIIEGPTEKKPEVYYRRLYGEILSNPRFIPAVHTYLMAFDYSGMDFHNPRDNAARRAMIESNLSTVERVFREFMAAPPFEAMRKEDVVKYCQTLAGEEGGNPFGEVTKEEIEKLYQKTKFSSVAIRIGGSPTRVWALTEKAKMDTKFAKDEMVRQGYK
ncbi:MAG: PriCT-2 domain-containing protein [Cardiobacteriaceae bacterium]|nr:PriCT-2 domain-containing protein [Cardiobacteriaceae bacterium]